jgi:sn-glycerol 3-phosphate transport system substrate-binding protein
VARLKTSNARLLAAGLAVALGFFSAPTTARAGESGARCQVAALERADTPVEITFWHVQQARNEEILIEQIDRFEASQDEVRVRLVNQLTYPDIFDKYTGALATDDLPDLVQMDETSVQSLVDSQSTIPIQRCVRADDYSLDDFVPEAIAHYTTEGVLRAMPWTLSNPILIYDRNAFRAAGLDPDRPPSTLDEVTEYSERLVGSGVVEHGISVRAEAFVNEALYAKAGRLYVNKENGRQGRATRALLDTKPGRQIWEWWSDTVESGLGLFTGSQIDNYDNLYAIGTGDAAMTIDASSLLGSIFAIAASGAFQDVDLGVAPLPSLETGGGVPVGDGSLWIPESESAAQTAAAWELVKYLTAPEQQTEFAVGSQGGYVPIRESSADHPELRALWDKEPDLKVPFEQFQSGGRQSAGIGPVIGDYTGVRVAVRDALTAMFNGDLMPKKALRRAQRDATTAIQEYNERVVG